MKTLYLMRHAKAGGGGGISRDHGRSLNNRGQEAAPMIGQYMATRQLIPQHILCSDAARTRETLELLLPSFPPATSTEIREDMYLASAPGLLKLVRGLSDDIGAAMIVGHNPGIESLTHTFADTGRDRDTLIDLEQNFPTAGLAVLSFDIDHWKQAGPGKAKLTDFVVPRELAVAEG